MKKIFTFLLTLFTLTLIIPGASLTSYAKSDKYIIEKIISETTEYFNDGSSMTITVIEEVSLIRGASYSKSGSKRCVMTNKSGSEICSFTVHGTFSVNPGISSVCTNASYSINITESVWENESASASCSGNQAIGDATFIKKILSSPLIPKAVTLSCLAMTKETFPDGFSDLDKPEQKHSSTKTDALVPLLEQVLF